MHHNALTLLILQLNSLLDSGRYDEITLEQVKDHIERGTILRFLRERTDSDLDLSFHLDDSPFEGFEAWYVEYLQAILNGYAGNERRKWGVENKGLCLLLAWTNEILQQGNGWKPHKDFASR